MGLCYARRDEICFEHAASDDDNWLRADIYEDTAGRPAVGFDRGGLCLLHREQCLQLAEWLTATAGKLPADSPPVLVRRKRGRQAYTQRTTARDTAVGATVTDQADET